MKDYRSEDMDPCKRMYGVNSWNRTGAIIMSYRIKMLWDNDAAVWIATSRDVPGLVLESGSFDA